MVTGRASQVRAGGAPSEAAVLPRDLVPVIVSQLELAGEYRVTLDPTEAQRLVDIRWAALSAGRLLGRRVGVVTSRAVETRGAPVTVLVGFSAEHHRPTIPRQRRYS
jgi:hypothetical protein